MWMLVIFFSDIPYAILGQRSPIPKNRNLEGSGELRGLRVGQHQPINERVGIQNAQFQRIAKTYSN